MAYRLAARLALTEPLNMPVGDAVPVTLRVCVGSPLPVSVTVDNRMDVAVAVAAVGARLAGRHCAAARHAHHCRRL